jgi:hypothetical protein
MTQRQQVCCNEAGSKRACTVRITRALTSLRHHWTKAQGNKLALTRLYFRSTVLFVQLTTFYYSVATLTPFLTYHQHRELAYPDERVFCCSRLITIIWKPETLPALREEPVINTTALLPPTVYCCSLHMWHTKTDIFMFACTTSRSLQKNSEPQVDHRLAHVRFLKKKHREMFLFLPNTSIFGPFLLQPHNCVATRDELRLDVRLVSLSWVNHPSLQELRLGARLVSLSWVNHPSLQEELRLGARLVSLSWVNHPSLQEELRLGARLVSL